MSIFVWTTLYNAFQWIEVDGISPSKYGCNECRIKALVRHHRAQTVYALNFKHWNILLSFGYSIELHSLSTHSSNEFSCCNLWLSSRQRFYSFLFLLLLHVCMVFDVRRQIYGKYWRTSTIHLCIICGMIMHFPKYLSVSLSFHLSRNGTCILRHPTNS